MKSSADNVSKVGFQPGELEKLIPHWPAVYPETDQKLLEIYHSGKWGMLGKYEKLLMEEFAAFQDTRYSVWMCNGTTTLECALLALGIGPGDEVIVPGITWIATAEAAVYVGAVPVIVDVDPETVCIDPERIEAAVTPRTRAIIPVHLYSALADMDRINAIAKKHGLAVIEDCAHAHGTRQHGRGAGSLGDIGSFSFQLSKLMTAGEGGCCTTDDPDLADRLFRLSHIGTSVIFPDRPLETGLVCHQYRFTEFQAAILCDQLRHQPELRARRRKHAALIGEFIRDIPSISLQRSSCPDDERDYYFLTFLLHLEHLKAGVDRESIQTALRAKGISLWAGWGAPLYRHPVWNLPQDRFVRHDTHVCEEIMYKRLLCTMHYLLLADTAVIERWAETLRAVMLEFTR